MSDKNRLEEIEKEVQQSRLDLERDDTINILELDKVEWVLKYAKEQAERVQELEELLTQIKYDKEAHIALSEKYLKKQLQNKRYREAIEGTLQAMGMVDRQKYGKSLERALEEPK